MSTLMIKGQVERSVGVDIVVDTGAQVTVMSERIHLALGSPKLTKVKATTKAADGSQLHLVGAMVLW